MDCVALWFEDGQNQKENVQPRRIRDSSNILDLSESRCEKTNCNISKLAVTLKFLAQGGFQHQIAQHCLANLSQSKLSVCITETCKAMEEVFCLLHISFVLPEDFKSLELSDLLMEGTYK